jgi:N-acetylneuraminate synthase/N,N'-diacetyllegionaminate synthase
VERRAVRAVIVIPARGGSRRLPRKNLAAVRGVSLVARAIVTAREFATTAPHWRVDIIVDTDSQEIAAEGRRWGAAVPFLRPAELAGDATPTIENVVFLLERLVDQLPPIDAVVLLQPTSPVRRAEDITRCWAKFDPAKRPSVVSVTATSHARELLLQREEDGTLQWTRGTTRPALPQQALAASYYVNGAVYIATPAFLRHHGAFVVPGCTRGEPIPPERSIDIDTAGDLALADAILAQTETPVVHVGDRQIGGGAACFIIAEAGINHNGDVGLAHRLVDAAAEAGADAVKFQTFDPEQVVSRRDESQLAMGRKLALPPHAFAQLRAHALERHLMFLSTPFDAGSADLLDTMGVPAFKIPSGEITNPAFLAHVARKGKPMLISTGMASLPEVVDALDMVRAHGSPPVALFHCVSHYPATPEECNLRAMGSMRSLLHIPVGWSDHSQGVTLSVAAVAMGAELLEKHFTLDRSLPGPDHQASLEPAELQALVRDVRATEAALGDGVKVPVQSELAVALAARRSLHAVRDIDAGAVLEMSDLVLLRPGNGVPAAQAGSLVGRRLKTPVPAGSLLRDADLE